MNHLVIGNGEVGKAVASVLSIAHEVTTRDLDPVPGPDVVGTLHIAFPWSKGFEKAVREYQEEYRPALTVIHSTVPVGTSRKLDAVHSPVTGKHPNLAPSVMTFTKFFGGPDADLAAHDFMECGVKTLVVPHQETTEAGKLWATLQYGLMIAIQKEAYLFCREHGADPEIAYAEFNRAYNDGYRAMGEPFMLPILRDMPGPIGGHCVIPNLDLTPTRLADLLRDMNEEWK